MRNHCRIFAAQLIREEYEQTGKLVKLAGVRTE